MAEDQDDLAAYRAALADAEAKWAAGIPGRARGVTADLTGQRIEPVHGAVAERLQRLAAGEPTGSVVPDHIRAAIHAGHVGQVTIYCDACGVEETGDYTGETREVRFEAARWYLAETKGWRIEPSYDGCPACTREEVPDRG